MLQLLKCGDFFSLICFTLLQIRFLLDWKCHLQLWKPLCLLTNKNHGWVYVWKEKPVGKLCRILLDRLKTNLGFGRFFNVSIVRKCQTPDDIIQVSGVHFGLKICETTVVFTAVLNTQNRQEPRAEPDSFSCQWFWWPTTLDCWVWFPSYTNWTHRYFDNNEPSVFLQNRWLHLKLLRELTVFNDTRHVGTSFFHLSINNYYGH